MPKAATVALLTALLLAAAAHAADGDLDLTFKGTGKAISGATTAGVVGAGTDAAGTVYLAYNYQFSSTQSDAFLVKIPDAPNTFATCGIVSPDLGGPNLDYAYTLLPGPTSPGSPQLMYLAGSAAGPAGSQHDRTFLGAVKVPSCTTATGFGGGDGHVEMDLFAAGTIGRAVLWVPDVQPGLRVLSSIEGSTVIDIHAVDAATGASQGWLGAADFDDGDEVLFVPATMLRQSDGKIVVVGTTTAADGDRDVVAARFHSTLGLDTSFGQQGFARFSYEIVDSGEDFATDAAVLPDDRIAIIGDLHRENTSRAVAVAVLKANGQYDTSFGVFGRYVFNLNDPDWGADQLKAVAVDQAGKVVVVGASDVGAGTANVNFAIARLKPTGASPLDAGFGGDGIVNVGFELGGQLPEVATSVAIDPQGRIVVGGSALNDSGHLQPVAARLKSGLLRDSFESGGTQAWIKN